MAFSLSTFIKPSLVFTLIKDQIEKQLNERPEDLAFFGLTKGKGILTDFDTIYNSAKDSIQFQINANGKSRTYPFLDGKKLCEIIKAEVAKGLKNNDILDILIVRYKAGDITAECYYTTAMGEKLLLEQKL